MKFLQNSKCYQRRNRRGGMLVLVLIIFAVSLILISSAMTITLASRSRYYVDTERSQERLTLSCAAQTVVGAIESQELPDEQLVNMINNGSYTVTGASMMSAAAGAAATDGKTIAPGLADSSVSQTSFTVSRVAEGSDDLYLTFSTCINVTNEDAKAENLRVKLKYNPPQPVTEICANMATFGDPSSTDVVDIQMLYVNTNKSYTVLHGKTEITAAGQTYINNPTVFTGVAKGGQGTQYYNDIIFFGPDAGMDTSSGGNGFTIASGKGDFFFLGTTVNGVSTKQSAFRNSDGSAASASGFNVKADGMYLRNATLTSSDWTAGGGYTKYWVVASNATVSRPNTNDGESNVIIKNGGTANINSSSSKVYDGKANIPADDTAALAAYERLTAKGEKYWTDKDLASAASHSIPTSDQQKDAYDDFCHGDLLKPSDLNNNDTVKDGNKAYQMSGTYEHGSLFIDLSKGNASIYMSGNVTLNSFHIECSNAYGNQLVIVLAKNVTLKFEPNPSSWLGEYCGILSCDSRISTNFSAPYASNLRATEGQKPAALIVGLGANTVSFAQVCIVDAYISLAGLGAEASTILFDCVGQGAYFYGRPEAVNFKYQNGGNPIQLAYCPSMSEEDNTPKPLTSNYTVEGYEYTYAV